jgi:ABC-2 type transport system ATP-binding protein
MIGRLRGGDKTTIRNRTHELIERLNIEEWSNRSGQNLSGGVRRLVGFCMAVVNPGKLVILDEPTNDIDPLRRRLLWAIVAELGEQGKSVLLVTHNVLESERAVNRLAIINEGTVKATFTLASLKGDAQDSLCIEVVLEPGAVISDVPSQIDYVQVGRRLIATVEGDEIIGALEWARKYQREGIVEEYSLGPSTLEDVYVKMVGPDAVPLESGASNGGGS